MPGLARIGDVLGCGDVIATGSGNVMINGVPAARTSDLGLTDITAGHCHGTTGLYRDVSSGTPRPLANVRINGVEAAQVGDWNINAAEQSSFPCDLGCGPTCHESQIVASSPDVGGGGCC